MDAQTLFRQAVQAIREEKDLARGQALLRQTLELDPHNDRAWVWLASITRTPQKRMAYLERALAINPANEHALAMKARVQAALASAPTSPPPAAPAPATAPVPAPAPTPAGPPSIKVPLTAAEQKRVAALLDRADIYREAGDTEAAIQQWVEVLKIRVDHEAALGGAVSHLWRLGYREDARELLTRALESGSTMPFVYLTALDLAGRLQDYAWLNALRQQILAAECDEALLLAVIEQDVRQQQMAHALDFLEQAISHCPDSQPLLVRMGELLQEIGRGPEAKPYYERAAALGARTRAGKAADQKLMGFVPVLTDRERGSVGLAVREVAGVGLFFLLAGLQDAELSLLAMGPRRWMGVLVSLIGGYLLVTATSSPQQRRIASWLGGRLIEPDAPANDSGSQALEEPSRLPSIPPTERAVLGTVGLALLALALILVFNYTFDVLL